MIVRMMLFAAQNEKPHPGMMPNWGFSFCYHSRPYEALDPVDILRQPRHILGRRQDVAPAKCRRVARVVHSRELQHEAIAVGTGRLDFARTVLDAGTRPVKEDAAQMNPTRRLPRDHFHGDLTVIAAKPAHPPEDECLAFRATQRFPTRRASGTSVRRQRRSFSTNGPFDLVFR